MDVFEGLTSLFYVYCLSFLTTADLISIAETNKRLYEDSAIRAMTLQRFRMSLRSLSKEKFEIDDYLFDVLFVNNDGNYIISGSLILASLHHTTWDPTLNIDIDLFMDVKEHKIWDQKLINLGFNRRCLVTHKKRNLENGYSRYIPSILTITDYANEDYPFLVIQIMTVCGTDILTPLDNFDMSCVKNYYNGRELVIYDRDTVQMLSSIALPVKELLDIWFDPENGSSDKRFSKIENARGEVLQNYIKTMHPSIDWKVTNFSFFLLSFCICFMFDNFNCQYIYV